MSRSFIDLKSETERSFEEHQVSACFTQLIQVEGNGTLFQATRRLAVTVTEFNH